MANTGAINSLKWILHIMKKKKIWWRMKWWPILGICALHLTHPSAHTQQWVVDKHTHTHTHPEQRAAIDAAAPGEQLGVWCLAQGSHLSRGIEGGQHWTLTPPTYNPCRTWDSNPQPLGYKSNSLSTRPRLPPVKEFLQSLAAASVDVLVA